MRIKNAYTILAKGKQITIGNKCRSCSKVMAYSQCRRHAMSVAGDVSHRLRGKELQSHGVTACRSRITCRHSVTLCDLKRRLLVIYITGY